MANNLHIAIAIALALFIGFFIGIMVAQAYIIPRPQLVIECINKTNLTDLAHFMRNLS